MKISKKERQWLFAITQSIFDSDLNIESFTWFLNDLEKQMELKHLFQFRASILLIHLSPMLVNKKIKTFDKLSNHEKNAIFKTILSSNYFLRLPLLYIKTITALFYAGLPEVKEKIGIIPVVSALPSWDQDKKE